MSRPYRPKPQNYNPPKLCGGKRSYASKAEAEKVMEEQELLTGAELSIYRCSACRQYHLTSLKTIDNNS